jgi:hypothetical protein
MKLNEKSETDKGQDAGIAKAKAKTKRLRESALNKQRILPLGQDYRRGS